MVYKSFKSVKNKILSYTPDDVFMKKQYKKRLGKELDLENPSTFNEKIQWLKLNNRKDLYTICADKYAVRSYIEQNISDDILIKLHGVYDSAEEIDFDKLPKSFVLKVTHGSGQNILCTNKDELDLNLTTRRLKNFLSDNLFYNTREWVYKNIPPRIVCEEFLIEDGKPPRDYKFFCFNGKPTIVQVDEDRFAEHRRNMYDLEWNLLDFKFCYSNSSKPILPPKNLDKMIEYATTLSKGMPFVRVDFYEVNGKVYFGEMTFYPENGSGKFYPEEYDAKFGELIKLPDSI